MVLFDVVIVYYRRRHLRSPSLSLNRDYRHADTSRAMRAQACHRMRAIVAADQDVMIDAADTINRRHRPLPPSYDIDDDDCCLLYATRDERYDV